MNVGDDSTNHQAMILQATELGAAGVESLIADLRKTYAVEYARLSKPLGFSSLLPQDHREILRRIVKLTAEYETRMAALKDLLAAYVALPRKHEELARTHHDSHADMALAVELVQNSLRLRELYHGSTATKRVTFAERSVSSGS